MENEYFYEIMKKANEACYKLMNDMELTSDNVVFCFRGESKNYMESSFKPSFFRDCYEIGDIDEEWFYELLCDFKLIDENPDGMNIKNLIDAQHYIELSRLLDVSFNLLVGLYFACISNLKHDGVLIVMCFPELFSPNSKYIDDLMKNLKSKREPIIPYNFKVISKGLQNERVTAQSGGFILFPTNECSTIPENFYKKIYIKASEKENILKCLSDFFGINQHKLFPQKDKLQKVLIDSMKFRKGKKQLKFSFDQELELFFNIIRFEIKATINKIRNNNNNNNTDDEYKNLITSEGRQLRKYYHDLLILINLSNLANEEKKSYILTINEKFNRLQTLLNLEGRN